MENNLFRFNLINHELASGVVLQSNIVVNWYRKNLDIKNSYQIRLENSIFWRIYRFTTIVHPLAELCVIFSKFPFPLKMIYSSL